MSRFKLFVLICLCELTIVNASSVLFKSGECNYNDKYFDNFNISIINNSVNLDLITKLPLTSGFKVLVDFSINLGRQQHYQRVFAHILDTCSVVSTMKSSIFKSWFQSMVKHGNLMINCPVTAGHYFVRNWKLDSKLVPQYLYAGDYRVTGHIFFGKLKAKSEEFVLNLVIYATLKT